jgi:hypothetical protein
MADDADAGEMTVGLGDLSRRAGVEPRVAYAALRTLAAVQPGRWPYRMDCTTARVAPGTAARLMEHIDRYHRPAMRKARRAPRAAAVAASLGVDSPELAGD